MPSKRGFSSMDPEKQRSIASQGGKAAHQKGTAHEFTTEEARAAGRKGGAASRIVRKTPSMDLSANADENDRFKESPSPAEELNKPDLPPAES